MFKTIYILLLFLSYTLVAKDIVSPREGEDIRLITKPAGFPTTSLTISDGEVIGADSITTIGEIKKSLLTEAQFQASMGDGWVTLNDEIDVSGSRLCLEFSVCTLPDARNRFLRNTDGTEASLRNTPEDSTAVNNVVMTWASVTENSSSAAVTWASSAFNVSSNHPTWSSATASSVTSQGSSVPSMITTSDTDQTRYSSDVNRASGPGSYFKSNVAWPGQTHEHNISKNTLDSNQTAHGHTINKNTLNSNQTAHGHTYDKTAWNTNQVWVEDLETAPDHIVVNFFIKIN